MICTRFEGFYESFIRSSEGATMKSKLELKLMGPCAAKIYVFFCNEQFKLLLNARVF
jgi:hypothetical protein